MARILVVDDESGTREVLACILGLRGHYVDGAGNGVEGLELLRSTEYDVVFVNWRMPVMDGLEMIAAASPITKGRIPVIFSSGSSLDGLANARRELKVIDLLLPLPFDMHDASSTFARALRLRRALLLRRVAERCGGLDSAARPAAPASGEVPAMRHARRDRASKLAVAFRAAGLVPPQELHWCGSPRVALDLVAERLRRQPSGSALRDRLAPSLGSTEPGPIEGTALRDEDLGRAVLEDLAAEIHRRPVEQRDALLLALLLAIPERPAAGPSADVRRQDDASAVLLRRSIHSAVGWLWTLDDGFAVATDPCVSIRRDAAGRLHSDTSPAIEYADGGGVYALHGFLVPERFVRWPEQRTIADVREPRNAEKRRILRECFGEERFLREVSARVVDVDSIPVLAADPSGACLTRALVEDASGARTLVASDGSTPRVYYMRVPRSCGTCAEAAVALAGLENVRITAEA